jgi:pimeloyl-ACP methyl ester carboxylesterase
VARLVLLPGLDGSGQLFSGLIEALGGFPTQVVSYPADRALDYAGHEAHVRGCLPRDEAYFLLAESFSGPVGIAIAAQAPAALQGLILCGSFAANPLPLFGQLSRLIRAFPAMRPPAVLTAPWLYAGRGTPELRRAHALAVASVAPATLRARVAAVLAVNYLPLLPKIRVPMLYLQAAADRLIPRSAGLAIQRLRPDTEFESVDAPHFLLQTEPHRCAAVILRFVARHDHVAGLQVPQVLQ